MLYTFSIEKLLFKNLPKFLFTLIPLFLITGPLLSDLSVSIICLLFLLNCFIKRNFIFFKNVYFYVFIIFCFYLILNSLVNNFNLTSLKISFFYFRYGVFVIAITTLLLEDHKFIKYFLYCLFFCFTILILDGFYQYFNGENIIGLKKSTRVSSFFGDELILGSYLSRLWPIFFGISLLFFKQKKNLFYLLVLIFILSEVLIFLSGDRTAFFYINLSSIFVILFSEKLQKLRFLIFLSSIFLIVVISLINPTAKERVVDQTLLEMNLLNKNISENKKKYIFSHAHHSHYVSALKMFKDNKILGVGVKNFRKFCKKHIYFEIAESCSTHPHNTYIQILAETGIIGFVFLMIVLIYFCTYIVKHLIYKINKKYYFNDFEICILSGIAIYLWPFVPTGSIFNNWLNIIMILNFPLLIWSRKFINT